MNNKWMCCDAVARPLSERCATCGSEYESLLRQRAELWEFGYEAAIQGWSKESVHVACGAGEEHYERHLRKMVSDGWQEGETVRIAGRTLGREEARRSLYPSYQCPPYHVDPVVDPRVHVGTDAIAKLACNEAGIEDVS